MKTTSTKKVSLEREFAEETPGETIVSRPIDFLLDIFASSILYLSLNTHDDNPAFHPGFKE